MQTKFRTNVLVFVEGVEQLGNPFNNGKDLVALHTQEVMEEEVVTSLTQLQNLGKDLNAEFVSHTIEQATSPITNTLKRQKVLTFANRPVHTKKGTKSGSAQRNSSLITKLFLSCSLGLMQTRKSSSAIRIRENHQVSQTKVR